MVTALGKTKDRVRALEIGVDDFLTKPVDLVELKARVRPLLKVKAYHDHMCNYQRELETEMLKRTEELREAFESIKDSTLETIFRLSRAAEYRDELTYTHLVRMSNYSAIIAKGLG